MPYFTYTRLNLYLDLISVIGFQHFISLWKAYNKSKPIAQFLQRNFEQIFAQMPLKGICTFSVFLEYTFRFWNFANVFAHLNWWVKGFSHIYNLLQFPFFFLHIFCWITRFCKKYLDFRKFAFFADNWSRAQGLSKNVSNVIALYHYKKIEGAGRSIWQRQE